MMPSLALNSSNLAASVLMPLCTVPHLVLSLLNIIVHLREGVPLTATDTACNGMSYECNNTENDLMFERDHHVALLLVVLLLLLSVKFCSMLI